VQDNSDNCGDEYVEPIRQNKYNVEVLTKIEYVGDSTLLTLPDIPLLTFADMELSKKKSVKR